MDSGKHPLVHDRLGDLPDCLLHIILSPLGSRQAVQTSVLSRRWRNLWRDVPCVNIDEREFPGDGQRDRFHDFADRILTSPPPEMRLDCFRLHLVSSMDYKSAASDLWIRRGLERLPAAVDICAPNVDTKVFWKPHVSIMPKHNYVRPGLSSRGSCAAGFTRRLTTLRLVGVIISGGFVEDLGVYCPVLKDLHMERCNIYMQAASSPTLRRLAIVAPRRRLACAIPLRLAVPCLASLRLDIPYDREYRSHYRAPPTDENPAEPLGSLTEASIRLLYSDQPCEQAVTKHELRFLRSMCSFLALLPNVQHLHLEGFTTKSLLEKEYLEFPVLLNLRSLLLEGCDIGAKAQALTSILCNTPNLEKLRLHHCTFLAGKTKRRASSKSCNLAPPVSWCKNLKSIEINLRQKDVSHVVNVLSEISKPMSPEQWMRIKISTTVV